MVTENQVKMAVISGASLALKMKEKMRHASDTEILQEISHNMRDILGKIDKSI